MTNRVVAIIQARVGSSRLPGKTLMRLGDQSVLARVLQRVQTCDQLEGIVVATTTQSADDAIEIEADACGCSCFRGSELDVLSRFHGAARMSDAQHIVRVTSDCPLIDPTLIDQMVRDYLENQDEVAYLSNANPRTFPHGLDTEIFSAKSLEVANREAALPHQREHVTPYLYEHPQVFRTRNFQQAIDQSRYRWTLDEADDLRFFQAVVRRLPDPLVSTQEVLDLLAQDPQLVSLNSHVCQKPLRDAARSDDATLTKKAG